MMLKVLGYKKFCRSVFVAMSFNVMQPSQLEELILIGAQ